MTPKDLGEALVAACREGTDTERLAEFYAPDAVSVEALDMGQGRVTEGLDGIRAKHDWWNGRFEMVGGTIEGPFPDGDARFAVIFAMEAKDRETGEVSAMKEVGLYTVSGGRIVREEFFYG